MTQKTSTKIKGIEEFRISGINDVQKEAKLTPNFRNEEILNISLDLFSIWLISSLLISPILFGETKPEIISNGFKYDGLSFL
jgi:hypothetical protein